MLLNLLKTAGFYFLISPVLEKQRQSLLESLLKAYYENPETGKAGVLRLGLVYFTFFYCLLKG